MRISNHTCSKTNKKQAVKDKLIQLKIYQLRQQQQVAQSLNEIEFTIKKETVLTGLIM